MIILPKCIQAITGTNTYELDSIGMSGSSIMGYGGICKWYTNIVKIRILKT
ncbi:MAG: hypothetical protein HFG39_05180 [Lachnospiraceae bacterium]|nr:hypothetical protein [Lachnospiraceae bacterium]